jgi:hypothetical protein
VPGEGSLKEKKKRMMTMKKTALSLSMLFVAGFLLVVPASADTINLSLTNPTQTGTSGATLTFEATLSAPLANNGAVFLNGDSFSVDIAGAALDDSGLFLNFPFSLDPGDSFSEVLFTVALPANLAAGVHDGFFEILGGSDPGAFNLLASVNFQIDGSSPVPEPGTWVLLATGLGLAGVWMVRCRFRNQPVC